jgi:hypothetical protein
VTEGTLKTYSYIDSNLPDWTATYRMMTRPIVEAALSEGKDPVTLLNRMIYVPGMPSRELSRMKEQTLIVIRQALQAKTYISHLYDWSTRRVYDGCHVAQMPGGDLWVAWPEIVLTEGRHITHLSPSTQHQQAMAYNSAMGIFLLRGTDPVSL